MEDKFLHPCIGDPLDVVDAARCLTCGELVVWGGKWIVEGRLCECCGNPICKRCVTMVEEEANA